MVLAIYTRIHGKERRLRCIATSDGRKVLIVDEREGCKVLRPVRWEARHD